MSKGDYLMNFAVMVTDYVSTFRGWEGEDDEV